MVLVSGVRSPRNGLQTALRCPLSGLCRCDLVEAVLREAQPIAFARESALRSPGAAIIPIPPGVKVWIAMGHRDMRRGMSSLSLQIQAAIV